MAARKEISRRYDQVRFMPVKDVLATNRYRVSRNKLFRLLKDGTIASAMPGGERLVDLDSGDAWFVGLFESRKPKKPHGNRKR